MATVSDLPHSANLANRWDNLRDYLTDMEADITATEADIATNTADIATNAAAIAAISADKIVATGYWDGSVALTGSLAPILLGDHTSYSIPPPDSDYTLTALRWRAQRSGYNSEWYILQGTVEFEEVGASTAEVEVAVQTSADGASGWTSVSSFRHTLVSGEHKTVHILSRAFKFPDADSYVRLAVREVSGSVQTNEATQTLTRLA